jgi:hypothetical protein
MTFGFPKAAALAALTIALCVHDARAAPKTVCTITVNSPDEKELMRRSLPQDDFRFVELVERGRPDWLASACRAGVRCDVLVVSGHFDGGTQFYSDRIDAREYLPVDEMERVSCSDSCPGLFSQLKEVYLFGCKTLDPQAQRSASEEVVRSFVRAGHSPADAIALARMLDQRNGESNRDRMRQVFKDVPLIYGFSSKAPLGPSAASTLERWFKGGGAAEFGTGRPSARLLALFAPVSMTSTPGLAAGEVQEGFRSDVCRLADDRTTAAHKVGFVHDLLGRDMAEVRMFLDHLETFAATLGEPAERAPALAQALAGIAGDSAARSRYLEFARDADEPAIRARMLALAQRLGWLSAAERRAEFLRLIGERLAANAVGPAEVELFCAQNRDRSLGADAPQLTRLPMAATSVGNAAVLACLGSAEAHARVLEALTSSSDADVEIAQLYLRHRPIADAAELRGLTSAIARMSGSDAQVRALDTLAGLRLSDRDSLQELARLFPQARSVGVQRAIAGVLIRADYRAIEGPALARELRQTRLKSPDGHDVIDVLIRRLQAAS